MTASVTDGRTDIYNLIYMIHVHVPSNQCLYMYIGKLLATGRGGWVIMHLMHHNHCQITIISVLCTLLYYLFIQDLLSNLNSDLPDVYTMYIYMYVATLTHIG